MAACGFHNRGTVEQEVIISAGDYSHVCRAFIDADCWTENGKPLEMGGFLDLPRPEWELASDRLVLTLPATRELYRLILDASNGRFLARPL